MGQVVVASVGDGVGTGGGTGGQEVELTMVKKRRLRERRTAVVVRVLDAIFVSPHPRGQRRHSKGQEYRCVGLLEEVRGMCEW